MYRTKIKSYRHEEEPVNTDNVDERTGVGADRR